MKKCCAALLAVLMLLSSLPAAAAADGNAIWDAAAGAFQLQEAPVITGVHEETNADGTQIFASYRAGEALTALFDAYEAADENADLMFARALGMDAADVEASLWLHIQFAYSLDGESWVFDGAPEADAAAPEILPARDFDLDGDGFYEYRNMPVYEMQPGRRVGEAMVVNGRDGCFTAKHCDDSACTAEEAIARCQTAMLQGRGVYLGSYDEAAPDAERGVKIALTRTDGVFIKARIRVFNLLERRVDGKWQAREERVFYSDWSEVYSYDPYVRPPIPDADALYTENAPALTVLGAFSGAAPADAEDAADRYRMAVRFPAETDAAIADFYALQYDSELLEEITGERYDPYIFIEIRVGGGDWYYLTDFNANRPYFTFDENDKTVREVLEALGYAHGDTVELRARLFGSDSWMLSEDETRPDCFFLLARTPAHIATAPSKPVSLRLGGLYSVTYVLNGGAWQEGASQIAGFSANDEFTVDLTAPDYTPVKPHCFFMGWFTTPDLQESTRVLSFSTADKTDRIFYAGWEEMPCYRIVYNAGAAGSAAVLPENPAKIYEDDGPVTLPDAACGEADFLGWYDAPEGGSRIASLSWADMTGDITLYARWAFHTHTVTYSGAGADYVNSEKNPESYTAAPTGETQLWLYAPEKPNYVFGGWYTDADLTEALPYDAEKDAYLLQAQGDVTVYAKWTAATFEIGYVIPAEAQAYFTNPNPTKQDVSKALVLQPLTPTVRLYRFLGWYDNAEFNGDPVIAVAKGKQNKTTLWAKVAKYLWGDADFDGKVGTGDARLVLRAAIGLDTFTEEQAAWTDLDKHDGTHTITTGDARLVLRVAIDLDTPASIGLPEVPKGF